MEILARKIIRECFAKISNDILFEQNDSEKSNNITYEIEHLNSYDGQHNYELGMYVNNDIVGMVEYVLFDGVLSVSNILVRPEFRRKGYGSRMMKFLKEKYKGEYEYKPSIKTSDGVAFQHKEISDLFN
jgi:ribosomal protein S18 acetylase RimI-like enzyme